MVVLTMLTAACDATTHKNGMTWPKYHVTTHFDHLDTRNVIVLLTIPSAPCDAAAGANDVSWPKGHVAHQFDHLNLRSAKVTLTMLFASHDADANGNCTIWLNKSCCTSLLLSWRKKYNGAIYDAVSIILHWHQLHHVTTPPMAACDANGNGNYVTWPKGHAAPHFDCLDVWNVVVPLTMLMASCDAISANSIAWPEKSCCTSFQSSWPKKCNGAIDNSINITCCLHQCQWQHMTKKSCYTSFQSFWDNGGIDDVLSIMWHLHPCLWHNMTKLQLISIVLT